jgi:hypothetical protein
VFNATLSPFAEKLLRSSCHHADRTGESLLNQNSNTGEFFGAKPALKVTGFRFFPQTAHRINRSIRYISDGREYTSILVCIWDLHFEERRPGETGCQNPLQPTISLLARQYREGIPAALHLSLCAPASAT